MYIGYMGSVGFHSFIIHPVAGIPTFHFLFFTMVIVSRKEGFVIFAETFESFQFTAYIHLSICIIPDIKRYNADRVAGNEKLVFFFIVECECENTVKLFQEVYAFVFIKRKYHFAIASCLKFITSGILCTYVPMIVYLTVYGKYHFMVGRVERLPSTFRVDDRKAFVCQDGTAAYIDTTPVRSAMTDFLCHTQCFVPQFFRLVLYIEYSCYSTHDFEIYGL